MLLLRNTCSPPLWIISGQTKNLGHVPLEVFYPTNKIERQAIRHIIIGHLHCLGSKMWVPPSLFIKPIYEQCHSFNLPSLIGYSHSHLFPFLSIEPKKVSPSPDFNISRQEALDRVSH